MNHFTRRGFVGAVALAVVTSLQAGQGPLPSGATILDRYIEVTGGRAAYEKLRTEVRTGTMELVGKGVRFAATFYRAAPDKLYTVMELPGGGKIEEGTDGRVAWSRSATQGPRIKEGEERAWALLASAFNADLRWRELYKSAETTGAEDVDGRPCYKVVVTSNDDLQQTRYYDQKTGFLVKVIVVLNTEMGEVKTDITAGDYKNVNGIVVPHRISQKVMGQEILITLDEVKLNVEIEKARFDLPDEIKALAQEK